MIDNVKNSDDSIESIIQSISDKMISFIKYGIDINNSCYKTSKTGYIIYEEVSV